MNLAPSGTVGFTNRFSGDEVIVGAPGTEGGAHGSVHVYGTRVPTSSLGTDRTAWDWELRQSLTGPSPLSRFGEAIAVWPDTHAPDIAGWFAAGAPGADRVQIITQFGSSWPPTFAVTQSIDAATVGVPTGSDFGAALVVGDFDRDGIMDLAIGAPGAGTVVIVHGQASGPPLDTADLLTIASPLPSGSGFGAALAAGDLYGADKAVGIAIGAPSAADGYACVAGIDGDFLVAKALSCGGSPYAGTTPHNWGAALALGNVVPRDVYGQTSTDQALVEELVVAAPGADRSVWAESAGDFVASSTAPAVGQIAVLRGVYQSGPQLPDGSPVPGERLPQTDLSTGSSGSDMGAALAIVDLQRTGHPDLIAGSPRWSSGSADAYGAVQVLNSDSVNGFDATQGGLFSGVDSANRSITVSAFGSGDSTFLSTRDLELFIEYRKPDGSICMFGSTAVRAVFEMNLNLAHTLGDGDATVLEDLILDARSGQLLAEVPPTSTFSGGDILEIDLTVSDANFDSEPTDRSG